LNFYGFIINKTKFKREIMADNKKDSTPINEEVLEETFGHYSEEITSSSNGEGTSHETEQVAKKKSSNMIIYVVCGVAAVLYIIYKVLFGASTATKPQAPQVPNKPATPIAQPQVNAPANNLVASSPATTTPSPAEQASVPANIATPASSVNQGAVPPTNVVPNDIATPASNVASTTVPNMSNTGSGNVATTTNNNGQDSTMVKDFLNNPNANNNNNGNINTTNPNVAPTSDNNVNTANVNAANNVPNLQLNHDVAPNNVAPVPQVSVPSVPAVATPTNNTVNVPAGVTDSSQVALLNSIKDMIGNQTTQLQSSIGGLANRVDRLEKSSNSVNSSINDIQARLAKLESKEGIQSPKTETLPTTTANVDNSNAATTTTTTTEKKEVKYNKVHRPSTYSYTKKHVWTKRGESKVQEAINDSDVLFTSQGAQPVNNVRVAPKAKSTYVIHSMIPGQIWIKNPDGTQSSYVVGDRLPNGDVIKKINIDKWSVETNTGVIR
jgi:hypothetical protein